MLTAMRALSCAALAAAVVVTVSACSSTTDGSGVAAGPAGSASSASTAAAQPSSSAAPATDIPTTPPADPTPTASPLRKVGVTAPNGDAYGVLIWAERRDATCAEHAYGQVADFLAAHPCTGLTRVLATTTVGGRSVAFAQSALGFRGTSPANYATAGEFRRLVSQDGTGNVTDLLRDGERLPTGPEVVPSPDAFLALGQDAGVVITDAWYLDGPTPENDPALLQMAKDLFLQLG